MVPREANARMITTLIPKIFTTMTGPANLPIMSLHYECTLAKYCCFSSVLNVLTIGVKIRTATIELRGGGRFPCNCGFVDRIL
jgi:hypothetical protein